MRLISAVIDTVLFISVVTLRADLAPPSRSRRRCW